MCTSEKLNRSMLTLFTQLNEDNKYIMLSKCHDLVLEQNEENHKAEYIANGKKIARMAEAVI